MIATTSAKYRITAPGTMARSFAGGVSAPTGEVMHLHVPATRPERVGAEAPPTKDIVPIVGSEALPIDQTASAREIAFIAQQTRRLVRIPMPAKHGVLAASAMARSFVGGASAPTDEAMRLHVLATRPERVGAEAPPTKDFTTIVESEAPPDFVAIVGSEAWAIGETVRIGNIARLVAKTGAAS